MTEEELKALEESPDVETPTNSDLSSASSITVGNIDDMSPEEKERRAKVAERQGVIIGGVFLILLVLSLIGFVFFQMNKNRILGLSTPLRYAEEETPEVKNVDPVKEKELAEPEKDTGKVDEDVENGEFTSKAYIANKSETDRWMLCDSCSRLAKAKDIYINKNNDITFVGSDGYIYMMDSTGYDAYTVYEIENLYGNRKFDRIINGSIYLAENGSAYEVSEPNEQGKVTFEISRSKLLNQLSGNFRLKNIYSFRANANDYDFTLSDNDRYYGVYDDKVYLINNEGKKDELLFVLGKDEDFVYISGNVIKTTKMFYSIQCTETSDGYDYKFYPDSINKYYNQIKFYNTNIVITNNNKVYFYGSPINYGGE